MSGFLPDPVVRIIVCGNADRGDDGAALAAIAHLLPTLPHEVLAKVEIRRCQELHVEDLVDLPPGVVCLVLDAVAGVEPGQVVRLPLNDLLQRPAFTPRSSHELPIDLVVGLAEIVRETPVAGTFVGLAGHGFDYGAPLSRVVRAAIPAYGEAIADELGRLAGIDPGVQA
jgi:hydrogenase maturation protease